MDGCVFSSSILNSDSRTESAPLTKTSVTRHVISLSTATTTTSTQVSQCASCTAMDTSTMDENLLETGDILVRLGNARGPFGIPFSWLVMKLSRSLYSHADLTLLENGTVYVANVGENGTAKITFAAWMKEVQQHRYAFYRVPIADKVRLKSLIKKLLKEDAAYDYTFADPNKHYCVEAVACVYERAGTRLCDPKPLKDILSPMAYWFVVPINWLVKKLTGKGFDMKQPVYFVGNEMIGLLSSPLIVKLYARL